MAKKVRKEIETVVDLEAYRDMTESDDDWQLVDELTEVAIPEFLDDHYVVRNALNLAVGDSGTGKTAFLVERTKLYRKNGEVVLWVGYEDTAYLKSKLKMALTDDDPGIPFIDGMSGAKWSWGSGGLGRILSMASRRGVDVIIIDSLFAAVSMSQVDVNNAADMLPILQEIDKVCADEQLTVILIHHFNKSGTGKTSSVAGSMQIRARCRGGYMFVKIAEESDLDGKTVIAVGQAKESYSVEVRPLRMEMVPNSNGSPFPEVTIDGTFEDSIEDLQRWEQAKRRTQGKGGGAPRGNTNAMRADTQEAMEALTELADPNKVYDTKTIRGLIANETSLGAYDKGVDNAIRVAKRTGTLVKTQDPFGNSVWKITELKVEEVPL